MGIPILIHTKVDSFKPNRPQGCIGTALTLVPEGNWIYTRGGRVRLQDAEDRLIYRRATTNGWPPCQPASQCV